MRNSRARMRRRKRRVQPGRRPVARKVTNRPTMRILSVSASMSFP